MSTYTTRNSKGSALTHGQLDGNIPLSAQTKAANYTVLISDNRDTIEVTATATIDLPDVATIIASSDTGDFQVTIKNNSGTTTIGRVNAANTINGVAADAVMTVIDSVTLKANQAGDGYNIIAGGVSIDGKILTNPVINVGVTGTGIDSTVTADATKIPNSQAVLNLVNANTRNRACRVDGAGAILGQSGSFTVLRTALGKYTITHNIGDTNYSAVASLTASGGNNNGDTGITLGNISTNTITVTIFTLAGTAFVDVDFNINFTLWS